MLYDFMNNQPTFMHGSTVFLMRSPTICSNLDLVSFMFICLGPEKNTFARILEKLLNS